MRKSAEPPGGTGQKSASDVRRDGWWRTLDEQADDPAFQERLHNEFPSQVEPFPIRSPGARS